MEHCEYGSERCVNNVPFVYFLHAVGAKAALCLSRVVPISPGQEGTPHLCPINIDFEGALDGLVQ